MQTRNRKRLVQTHIEDLASSSRDVRRKWYEVVVDAVYVRTGPSTAAPSVMTKWKAERVLAVNDAELPWILVAENEDSQPVGFMLSRTADGEELLRPCTGGLETLLSTDQDLLTAVLFHEEWEHLNEMKAVCKLFCTVSRNLLRRPDWQAHHLSIHEQLELHRRKAEWPSEAALLLRIETHPDEARMWETRKAFLPSVRLELPLHRVLQWIAPPDEVVVALLRAYPESIHEDLSGPSDHLAGMAADLRPLAEGLPLHLAVRNQTIGLGALSALLDADVSACLKTLEVRVGVEEKHGFKVMRMLPIAAIMQEMTNHSIEHWQMLLAATARAHEREDGKLPRSVFEDQILKYCTNWAARGLSQGGRAMIAEQLKECIAPTPTVCTALSNYFEYKAQRQPKVQDKVSKRGLWLDVKWVSSPERMNLADPIIGLAPLPPGHLPPPAPGLPPVPMG